MNNLTKFYAKRIADHALESIRGGSGRGNVPDLEGGWKKDFVKKAGEALLIEGVKRGVKYVHEKCTEKDTRSEAEKAAEEEANGRRYNCNAIMDSDSSIL